MQINRTLLAHALRVSLEAVQAQAEEAKTEVELEHTWYAKIVDVEELKLASASEQQEQWQVKAKKNDDMRYGGCVRVRSINGERYVMTIKNFEDGKRGVLENEFDISQDGFEAVKRISESGMIKTRYTFPIEGTEYHWEIDVFSGSESNGSWIKIDLEVDDPNFQIPAFPIQLTGVIADRPGQRSEEEEQLIEDLMKRYFRANNPFTIER